MIYGSGSSLSKKDGSGWTAQDTYVYNGDKLGLAYLYDENGYVKGVTYEIKSSLSNKNLDLSASNGTLSFWGANDGTNQRWTLTHISAGYYKIISVNNPKKGLDVTQSGTTAATYVGIWPYGGSDNQLWQIVPGPTTGTYQLFSKHVRRKPLDVAIPEPLLEQTHNWETTRSAVDPSGLCKKLTS